MAAILVLCGQRLCPQKTHAGALALERLPQGWSTGDTFVRLVRRETVIEGGRYIYVEQRFAGVA